MALLDIKRLRVDGGTQHGGRQNMELVAEYAEAYLEGKKLPPVRVIFDEKDYWLWDGFHRVAGAMEAGQKSINVEVERGTQREAFLKSLGANTEHGMRRSQENKRAIVLAALQDEELSFKSDRELAKICGVSHSFIADQRSPEDLVVKHRTAKKVQHEKTVAEGGGGVVTNGIDAICNGTDADPAGPEEPDDPKAPSDTVVRRPKPTILGSVDVISRERDEYKSKVLELGSALEETMAELAAFEQGVELNDNEQALRAENKRLRKDMADLQSRFDGVIEERNAAISRANHWKKKAGGK